MNTTDPNDIVHALQGWKIAFDTFRGAIGLMKDVKGLLPQANQAEVEGQIVQLDIEVQVAEAALAKSLGYKLHQCQFPPTIMLYVGSRRGGEPVFECPVCGENDQPGFTFNRSAPPRD